MPPELDELSGFVIYYERFTSWVIHNILGNNRPLIRKVLAEFLKTGFLRERPDGYKPGDLIYFGYPYTHVFREERNLGKTIEGVLGLLFAADDPNANPRRIMLLEVQVPVSPETAQPGYLGNCHLTTEIYPVASHSLIPVSYEFARGTIPGKRLNYIVRQNGEFDMLPQSEGIKTGFKHFVSTAYSQYGLAELNFQLTVRHQPSEPPESEDDEFFASREEFQSKLRQDVSGPLQLIEQELYNDSGTLAPENIEPISFLDNISVRMSEVAYANMAIFKQELDSNINPDLHGQGFGKHVQPPPEEEAPVVDYSEVTHALVWYPGALEAALMIADRGTIRTDDPLLLEIIPKESFLETVAELHRTGLIQISEATLQLTELGDLVVRKLRSFLRTPNKVVQ